VKLGEAGNGWGDGRRELSASCINFATALPCASIGLRSTFKWTSEGLEKMRNSVTVFCLAALVSATSAGAKAPPNTGTPAVVQQLLACRSISDSAQRLACYDRQTAVINQAIATRDLVVIDKARASAAKRSLFGFSIPNFGGLFGNDEMNQIEGTITGVSQNADGGWVVRLSDGSVWSQVDDAQLGLPPRRGDKVTIKRGSLGSFYLDFPKYPGFKVKRIG
jgi:hypothetical protein